MLLRLLMRAFVPTGPVVIGIDDPIERRRGERIAATGIDPMGRAGLGAALSDRGVALGVLRSAGWSSPSNAIGPCASGREAGTTLAAREGTCRGGRPDLCRACVARCGPARRVCITRWHLDAALYEPASPRQLNQNGRPRKQGKRLPTLEKVLANSMTHWTTVTVAHWYGERGRHLQTTSNAAIWYHSGQPVVPIRWVLMRDSE